MEINAEWAESLLEQFSLECRKTISLSWHGCSMCGTDSTIRFTIFSANESPVAYFTAEEADQLVKTLQKMTAEIETIRREHGG